MKKIWLCIVIAILFIALFLMPMAWGVLGDDDIVQLNQQVSEATYKKDVYIASMDKLQFMAADPESDAGKAYAAYLALPTNWAEKMYLDHEAQKRQESAAQRAPKKA